MGINARSALHPRYTRFAGPVLRSFCTATVELVVPNTKTGDDNFNPWTNATNSSPEVLWEGATQMQIYRQTLNAEIPGGGITQVRSIRFTVPLADIEGFTTPIRKGLIVNVTAMAENSDQSVMEYQYTVTSAIGAGDGWTRTIEAEANMGIVR